MALGSIARRNGSRAAFLGAAILTAAGCAGKDKSESGLRAMDPRVKAALTGPEGAKPAPTPAAKVATYDSNATGGKDLSKDLAFNRTKPFMPTGTTTGASLAQAGPGMPVQPTSGGRLVPEKPAEVTRYEAPVPPTYDGPLPKPAIHTAAMKVEEPLSNPTPADPPAPKPIVPAGAMSPPLPPPAPVAGVLSAPPLDTGTVVLPSPTEKPIEGFPISPGMIK